jgi:hypothetical protein
VKFAESVVTCLALVLLLHRLAASGQQPAAKKTLGDAVRVPRLTLPFVSSYFFFLELDFFFEAFLVAIVFYSPFRFIIEYVQRSFVAMVECIESLKNEVKKKMVDVSCYLSSHPKGIG